MRLRGLCSALALPAAAMLAGTSPTSVQAQEDKPLVNLAANAKFGPAPNAPACFTIAVERGDPGSGPSVILARFAPACTAPFHWHTPSETAMMVSGSLQIQMKDDKPLVARRGDFAYLPSRHVHRATCLGAAPCLVFLSADAPFDIHWVDGAGQEISLDAALKAGQGIRPRGREAVS
jgi:quercetin dioxygenase-like cupin family protein